MAGKSYPENSFFASQVIVTDKELKQVQDKAQQLKRLLLKHTVFWEKARQKHLINILQEIEKIEQPSAGIVRRHHQKVNQQLTINHLVTNLVYLGSFKLSATFIADIVVHVLSIIGLNIDRPDTTQTARKIMEECRRGINYAKAVQAYEKELARSIYCSKNAKNPWS